MNTNFSKYWHFFYLSIITIFAYIYWFYAPKDAIHESIYDSLKIIRQHNEILDTNNGSFLREIDENTRRLGYVENQKAPQIAEAITEVSKNTNDFLKAIYNDFINHCGGANAKYTDGRAINDKNVLLTRAFFDNKKIATIKQVIQNFETITDSLLASFKPEYLDEMSKFRYLKKDEQYWEELPQTPPANAHLKLMELINNTKSEEYYALNQILRHLEGINNYSCAGPRIAICTNEINLGKNPYIEGNLGISAIPFIQENRDLSYYVNGQKAKNKEGIFYFKVKPKNKGKNTIWFECEIKNPLTGYVEIVKTKREYWINECK